MNNILVTILNRSTLSISKSSRFTSVFNKVHRNARSCAVFQHAVFYTNERKQSHDKIKFPWIWPSSSKAFPKNPSTFNYEPTGILVKLLIRVLQKIQLKFIRQFIFRDASYLSKIHDGMIPLVLGRIADAINEKDVNQMDELMTPYLAKLYKQGVGSLNTHGLRMHLEINVQGSNTKDDFERLKLGNPEAYDYTIPYNVRDARYSVWKLANTIVALKKTRDGEIMTGGIKDGFGGNLFSQWLALEFGFVVNANIKIGLYKDNQLIDSDSGMMQIPIAISSPHYLGMQALIDAVAAGKQAEEPFRWRVCDLFYAAALNNANEVFMANKENNS